MSKNKAAVCSRWRQKGVYVEVDSYFDWAAKTQLEQRSVDCSIFRSDQKQWYKNTSAQTLTRSVSEA